MEKALIEKIKEKFGYKNDLAVPKIEKIVVNVGVGRLSQQANFEDKILPELTKEFSLLTGQKPVLTKAKKSIAGFKTRAGQVVGLKATLRGGRMEAFLKKLNNIVFPRIRDFRGIELDSIDENGNLNVGLRDHLVFPEINPEDSKIDFGMEISIVSSIKKRGEAEEFYRILGIPLKKHG